MHWSRAGCKDGGKWRAALTWAAVLFLAQGAQSLPPKEERPPNFILIFTDDQGYQDLGCFGSPLIKTPRIDRMAAQGVRFTSFYSAAPSCTGSRAALMTGCYPQRLSLPSVLSPRAKVGIHADEITVAQLLKERGYATACVGKWHLGHLPPFLPTRHGFDSYLGLPYSNDMGRTERGEPLLPLMRNEEIIEQPAVQETLTERYTEEAVRFIRANKDRPFFLYLPHTFPHVPLHVSQRFAGKSARGLYGDVIECIDWSVGRILDTLAELQLDDKTLIVYSSDNGPWLSKGQNGGSALPLRSGKGTTYEGGMREPCVMWRPGHIPPGAVCSEVAATIDILPTFARLVGAEPPADRMIDGKDIWPLMAGQPGAKSPHEAYFYYKGYALEAVRSGQWKLRLKRVATAGPDGKKKAEAVAAELYDLEADIGEQRNLLAEHPDVVQRLLALADRCREDLGDSLSGRKGRNVRPCGRD